MPHNHGVEETSYIESLRISNGGKSFRQNYIEAWPVAATLSTLDNAKPYQEEHNEIRKNDQSYKKYYNEAFNSTFQVQLKLEEDIRKMNQLKLIKDLPELI